MHDPSLSEPGAGNPVSVRREGDIAIVTIDNPPVNALSHPVRQGLWDALELLDADKNVRAVVLICAGRTFVAGADIREFSKPAQAPHLPELIQKLEMTRAPWLAALHGTALGGGLELALGCRFRIALSGAKLGLPEVTLGLIPGAGGTVRLPRLIGARAALDMIATGRPVAAVRAAELGLLDEVTQDDLLLAALKFLADRAKGETLIRAASGYVAPPEDDAAWRAQKDTIRAKAKGQNAPIAAINAVENAIRFPAPDALAKEREAFLGLKDGLQSKALRYVFFAERSVAKLPRLKGVAPRPFAQIGIVGGGTMGAGIAAACLLAGLKVTMLERDQQALNAGLGRVRKTLEQSHARQLIDKATLGRILAALNGVLDYDALAKTDLIIEAVFEDMAVKKQVFARLDAAVRPDVVLASNTSYLDIAEIADVVHDPSRVLGLHFFSPAYVMKLLEIIHTDTVADNVLATGFALAKRLRKVAVPAGVCDGFIANRMMSAYRRDCEYMLEEGALPQNIDAAMVAFGFPMGVFAMQDLAGLDIAWATRKRRAATRPDTERYVDIADHLCELGRFGHKSGRGWYDYSDDPAGKPDPTVERLILRASAQNGISRRVFDGDNIMSRILAALESEGRRILDEGVAQSEQAIDVVMVNGYGFPRCRGGPMFMRSNF